MTKMPPIRNVWDELHAAKGKDSPHYLLTPYLAQRVLEESRFDGQRLVAARRLMMHKNAMINGEFDPRISTITLATINDSRRRYLVDGQTRLTAIVETGEAQYLGVNVVDEPNMDAVRILYAKFDRPESVRTMAELVSSAQLAAALGINNSDAERVVRSMPLYRNNLQPLPARAYDPHTLDLRNPTANIAEAAALRDPVQWWAATVLHVPRYVASRLRKVTTLAAMLVTRRDAPELADRFWSGVAADDGLTRDDPRKALLNVWANETAIRVQNPAIELMQISLAWNAYVGKRPLRILRPGASKAIRFSGTRVAGD